MLLPVPDMQRVTVLACAMSGMHMHYLSTVPIQKHQTIQEA